jgi:hypothetical protein
LFSQIAHLLRDFEWVIGHKTSLAPNGFEL